LALSPLRFMMWHATFCHTSGSCRELNNTFSSATDRALLWHSEVTTMATLQSINNVFHIDSGFDGHPYPALVGYCCQGRRRGQRKQVE